ncbi:MAG TPA: YciI family protein [Streptosporangiaceae bacterium]
MSAQAADPGGADMSRLLARDYWLVWSTPAAGADAAAIRALAPRHVAWLLELERAGALLVSGPLLSGPGTGPGSGVTVLRAPGEDAARDIAARDPFVRAGLRTFAVHRWRLNEGSISVRLSLGTGGYEWH